VGMGLSGFVSCSFEALEVLKQVDVIYLESYTNFYIQAIPPAFKDLEKKIKILRRENLEEGDQKLLDEINHKTVAILIPGDPFIATTHNSFRIAATQRGYSCKVIYNTSIISAAISASGLSSYRFGRTVTCPFPDNRSEFPYRIIQKNKAIEAHTLILLDINVMKETFLSIPEAINFLLDLEEEFKESVITPSSLVVGLARLGYDNEYIATGSPPDVLEAYNWKGIGPPQAIIVCADSLHFSEEESLSILWKSRKNK
jgi:diphthine synthase